MFILILNSARRLHYLLNVSRALSLLSISCRLSGLYSIHIVRGRISFFSFATGSLCFLLQRQTSPILEIKLHRLLTPFHHFISFLSLSPRFILLQNIHHLLHHVPTSSTMSAKWIWINSFIISQRDQLNLILLSAIEHSPSSLNLLDVPLVSALVPVVLGQVLRNQDTIFCLRQVDIFSTCFNLRHVSSTPH